MRELSVIHGRGRGCHPQIWTEFEFGGKGLYEIIAPLGLILDNIKHDITLNNHTNPFRVGYVIVLSELYTSYETHGWKSSI
jgi:hypothetical protein